MKIGVTSDGDDLTSYVSEDFGHAPFFLIVDYDTLDYEVVENEFINAEGAGMKVADAIVSLGIDAVISVSSDSAGYDCIDAE